MATTTTFAVTYGTWTTWNITLTGGLATSSTLVAGRQSDVLTLTLDDLEVAGSIFCGTSPTAGGIIQIWAFAKQDASTYPDVFGASDAAVTVTSANVKAAGFLKPVMSAIVDNVSDRGYPFHVGSLKWVFGGRLPETVGLFVTHSTGVNLKTTLQTIKYRTITDTATTS